MTGAGGRGILTFRLQVLCPPGPPALPAVGPGELPLVLQVPDLTLLRGSLDQTEPCVQRSGCWRLPAVAGAALAPLAF